jgi:hypothetical protein
VLGTNYNARVDPCRNLWHRYRVSPGAVTVAGGGDAKNIFPALYLSKMARASADASLAVKFQNDTLPRFRKNLTDFFDENLLQYSDF